MADIYLLIESKQEGPYTEQQVRQALDEGQIPNDQLAWKEGLVEWVPVSGVLSQVTVPAVESEAEFETVGHQQATQESQVESQTLPVMSSRRTNVGKILRVVFIAYKRDFIIGIVLTVVGFVLIMLLMTNDPNAAEHGSLLPLIAAVALIGGICYTLFITLCLIVNAMRLWLRAKHDEQFQAPRKGETEKKGTGTATA